MSCLKKDFFLACFVYLILSRKVLDLMSDIKNLIFFNKWQYYIVFKKGISISSFIVNITDYCSSHGRVVGHIPFAALLSHTEKFGNRCCVVCKKMTIPSSRITKIGGGFCPCESICHM
jgi:hypothetical protein